MDRDFSWSWRQIRTDLQKVPQFLSESALDFDFSDVLTGG
jgi:hypothetical protein